MAMVDVLAPAEPEQEQASQVVQEREQCVKCKKSTPRFYRDEQGWLCAGCAPQNETETCYYEGCEFQDIDTMKRSKHTLYFCQRRTKCLVCYEDLQPGTQLQQHYKHCEAIKVIPLGSKFLVQHNKSVLCFLVETAAGHVLCRCIYTEHDFNLWVLAPVPCEQLHQYRCEVRLECAGNTRTHTPDTNYKS